MNQIYQVLKCIISGSEIIGTAFKRCIYFQNKREREKIECDVENLREKSETQKLDNDQMRGEITFLRFVDF